MSVIIANASTRVPVHLWIVGVLSLLWNSVGAFDYLATQLQLEFYMSQFSAAQLEYFYNIPAWAVAAWAIAVWFSVLGSLALLLRRRRALDLFVIALVAMLASTVNSFLLSDGLQVMGNTGAIFSAAIVVIGVLLVIYSRAMIRRGVLR
ncbi:MAG: hypothetical protein KKC01_13035 [Gammaproteobacteria bacterium]|nr:hypothetical protein [Gammaproteobacteria bacterium]